MEFTSITLALVLLTLVSAQHSPMIVRPNLGIVLLKDRDITLSPSIWHHTIAIPFFPDIPMTTPAILCNTDAINTTDVSDTCTTLQEINNLYMELKHRMTSDIQYTHTSIMDVMTVQDLAPKRVCRGWFNLLGNIAKKVMGVATEGDIKILQGHMTQLMDMIRRDKKDRIHDITKLHSYEVKADLRMNRLQKHLVRLDQTLTDMSTDIDTLQTYAHFAESLAKQVNIQGQHINATMAVVNWLHHFNVNLHTLNQLRVSAASQLSDINQLIKGRLTVNLIDPQHLRSILGDINAELRSKSQNLYIKSDITIFYTHNNMVTSSHDNKFLYVKIKIPVSSQTTEFSLYKIDTVPVPTSHDNDIYTELFGFSKWFAISADTKYFLEIPEEDVYLLKDVLNTRNYLPTKAHNASCPYSLFMGDSTAIMSVCRHRLVNKPIMSYEFVYTVPAQGYLIYTPARAWTLQCQYPNSSGNTKVTHKGLFQVNIQCGCKLTSHLTELLADSTHCATTKSTTSYSANFLVYQKLYKESLPVNLTINDFTTEPFNFQLPELIHIKLNFTDLELNDGMTTEDQTDLDNFHFSDSTDDLAWSFTNWSDMPAADTIIAAGSITIITIQLGCIMVLLHYHRQFNRINQLLITLAAIQGTEAADFFLPTTATTPASTSEPATIFPTWRTVIIIASFVLSLINILIMLLEKITPLLAKCEPSTRLNHLETDLYCAMYSDQHQLHIKITTIPHDLSVLTVSKTEDPHDVTFYTNILCTYASLNWAQLEIYAGTKKILLPNRVSVPLCHYRAFTSIARHRHTVKFILMQSCDSLVISDWSRTDPVSQPPQPVLLRFGDSPSALYRRNPSAPTSPTDPSRVALLPQPGTHISPAQSSTSATGHNSDCQHFSTNGGPTDQQTDTTSKSSHASHPSQQSAYTVEYR